MYRFYELQICQNYLITFSNAVICRLSNHNLFNTKKASINKCQARCTSSTAHNFHHSLNTSTLEKRAISLIYQIIRGDHPLVTVEDIKKGIENSGIRWKDPRFCSFRSKLEDKEALEEIISFKEFSQLLQHDSSGLKLLCRIFSKSCIIPNFKTFGNDVQEIFHSTKENTSGKVADYIPQLAKESPELWGISICTIDGQRLSLGDSWQPFCLQSCVKPFGYALAATEYHSDVLHKYVGKEPSGMFFNSLALNSEGKPHNPMINAGALVVCSLIEPQRTIEDRFDFVTMKIEELCGGETVGFDELVFLSEREVSFRNLAISYLIMENKGFPEGADLYETMELYLKMCAMTVTCESGAIAGATLANGGVSPYHVGGNRLLDPIAVRNTLTLMHSCGMYDYSGKFAFHVGLPAKSGVAGGLLVVIPNVMSIMCRSPRLDDKGNSVKGVQFCREFVNNFNFHVYDNLRHSIKKTNPRELSRELTDFETELRKVSRLMFENEEANPALSCTL